MDTRTRNELIAVLPRIRRFARALTGDRSEADDLVQTVCERAIARIDQWSPATRLDSWLYRIVQTVWIDMKRAQKTRRDYATAVLAIAPVASSGEVHALATLTVGAVDQALQRLPEEQRAVVLLVCVEGLSYGQTAEVLGVPIGTVMSRLARGRLALRRLVDGVTFDRDMLELERREAPA
jgi:RNA polymerase sigma-70 factor (ECF subfamily)